MSFPQEFPPHGEDGKKAWSPSSATSVSCSICLELVLDDASRSLAKLPCGHEFHLDCIGSAFNVKGSMQCPNCRKVENGQWLYAAGSSRPARHSSTDNYFPEEGFYYLGYPETQYRFHWCPFGESFEDVDSPSTTHHEQRRFHTAYAHSATSSVASSSGDAADNPSLQSDFFPYPPRVPSMNVQYFNFDRHAPPFSVLISHVSVAEPTGIPHVSMRPSVGEHDVRAFPDPFLFPYRPLPMATGFRQAVPHRQRGGNPFGMPSRVMVPRHDHGGGFFVAPPREAESGLPTQFHGW